METKTRKPYLLTVELAIRRRAVVVLREQAPTPTLNLTFARSGELESGAHAHAGACGGVAHDLYVRCRDQAYRGERSDAHRPPGAQLSAAVPEKTGEIARVASHERLAAAVDAKRGHVDREQPLGRLEGEVLARRRVGAKQKLVAE